jgi:hypothetical protein
MSKVVAYLVKETLKDGNEVTIRAMRPDDKKRLVEAFLHLQPQTIRTRFFYPKKTLSERRPALAGRNQPREPRGTRGHYAKWMRRTDHRRR